MNIVAFMQNPWFDETTDPVIIEMYRTNQEFHRNVLARTMSGQRLLAAFGDVLFHQIWWDNASPDHSHHANGSTCPDVLHIEQVVLEKKPKLILTFGNSAREAVGSAVSAIPIRVMECHHPNARHHTQHDLDVFAQEVREFIKQYDDIEN